MDLLFTFRMVRQAADTILACKFAAPESCRRITTLSKYQAVVFPVPSLCGASGALGVARLAR